MITQNDKFNPSFNDKAVSQSAAPTMSLAQNSPPNKLFSLTKTKFPQPSGQKK